MPLVSLRSQLKLFLHHVAGQQLSEDGRQWLGRPAGLETEVPSAVQHAGQAHEWVLVR